MPGQEQLSVKVPGSERIFSCSQCWTKVVKLSMNWLVVGLVIGKHFLEPITQFGLAIADFNNGSDRSCNVYAVFLVIYKN